MRKLRAALAAALLLLGGPAFAANLPWFNSIHYQCSALCSSLSANPVTGPHTMFTWSVWADSTLSASAWYILIYDAGAVPSNGSVTPAKCYAIPSGVTQAGATLTGTGEAYPNGVVIVASTTGCFTQTTSTHAMIMLDWQ